MLRHQITKMRSLLGENWINVCRLFNSRYWHICMTRQRRSSFLHLMLASTHLSPLSIDPHSWQDSIASRFEEHFFGAEPFNVIKFVKLRLSTVSLLRRVLSVKDFFNYFYFSIITYLCPCTIKRLHMLIASLFSGGHPYTSFIFCKGFSIHNNYDSMQPVTTSSERNPP